MFEILLVMQTENQKNVLFIFSFTTIGKSQLHCYQFSRKKYQNWRKGLHEVKCWID